MTLSALPQIERDRLEAEIVRSYDACGCAAARWALGAVVVAAAIAFAVTPAGVHRLDVAAPALCAALVLPLAAMLVSVANARLRLWRAIDRALTLTA